MKFLQFKCQHKFLSVGAFEVISSHVTKLQFLGNWRRGVVFIATVNQRGLTLPPLLQEEVGKCTRMSPKDSPELYFRMVSSLAVRWRVRM